MSPSNHGGPLALDPSTSLRTGRLRANGWTGLDSIKLRRYSLLAAVVLLCSGCASLGPRDAIEELAAFQPLPGMPQIRHAPGAERFAERVAASLPNAIAQVEAGHYRPFRSPPVVYVCGTDECFRGFVPVRYNFTAAVVYANRLVLAPRLFDREPRRLAPILVHELSHLHLGQTRGHYTTAIPVWFHEGLASLVANGGGADLVNDVEAWQAAERGQHFLPDEQHLPWTRKMAGTFELPVNVFYRQAYIYLRDLRARDEDAFRRLIELLYDGADFDTAFAGSMHANPQRSGLAYFRRLQCAGSAHGGSPCDSAEVPQ